MSTNINVEEAVAEGVARADQGQVGLGGLAPLFQRREQFRIEPRQAGEVLGTEAVRLAPLAIDEPELPGGVGHQHLATALLQEEPANPGRTGADLAIATRIGSEPEKRLWSAAGLVGIRLSSSTTSPLAVSIRHRRWLYRSPTSTLTVMEGWAMAKKPPFSDLPRFVCPAHYRMAYSKPCFSGLLIPSVGPLLGSSVNKG